MNENWDKEKGDWEHLQEDEHATNENHFAEWRQRLFEELLRHQEEKQSRTGNEDETVPEREMRRILQSLVSKLSDFPSALRKDVIDSILDDMYRMGPLESLWELERVSDVQCFIPHSPNYPQIITYMEEGERKVYTGKGFRNYDAARDWINTHLSKIGLKYDPSKVQLDGMLPNGERIHVISGPAGYSMKLDGKYTFVRCMIISIRRFVSAFTMEQLTDKSTPVIDPPSAPSDIKKHLAYKRKTVYHRHTVGMGDPATMDYLRIAIRLRKNYLAAGGTGVGKTTIANAMTGPIPRNQVLLILEEAPEMQPQREGLAPECPAGNVIRIYQRGDTFRLADGMTAALRMFPDRIFVAEIRNELAYVFIDAIQSGHDGSGTTLHAGSCLAAINRAVNMAATHPSAPERPFIREIIFDRINFIVHATKIGTRRFFDELIQLLPNEQHHKVMEYVQKGTDANGQPVGYWAFYGPTDDFIEEMMTNGIDIPESWGWEVITA